MLMTVAKPKRQSKPLLDPDDFRLRYEISRPLLADEPSDFIREIDGSINLFNEDHEQFDIPLGKVSAYRVEVGQARAQGESILNIFDSRDDELVDYYEALYEGDEISPEIHSKLEPGFGCDLLIIDRIEVDPEFRGMNLGLIAALWTIKTFSDGCEYVVLRPWPLQYGPYRKDLKRLRDLKYDTFTKSEKRAREKLRQYWGRLGFRQIRDSDVYILSTAYVLPVDAKAFCKIKRK